MAAAPGILILGAGGFVGGHLVGALRARFGADATILATGQHARPDVEALDIRDLAALRAALRRFAPSHVINLVGIASPPEARRQPELAWHLHARAPEALGRLILEECPECWLLHVGSGLIYGRTAAAGHPVDESARLEPMDGYGVTKAAGDLALGALAGEGLRCLRLRPFNHTGPGQSDAFAIPAFASQIARIEKGLQPPVLKVGNLDAVRDFLDVRDVTRAYADLVAASADCRPGAVFNIASGQGWRMSDILSDLCRAARTDLRIEQDPARQRPSDLPAIVGDATALAAATGWAPRHSLQETLLDTLNAFRAADPA